MAEAKWYVAHTYSGYENKVKADLEKTVGKPVETVPQIFVDQKHIGGCTDFEAWAKENLGLFA